MTSLHSYWQSVYHYQDVSPNFDDTLGTIAASLARLSARHFTNSAVQCSISSGKVYEVTSYLQNDNYKVRRSSQRKTFVLIIKRYHNFEVENFLWLVVSFLCWWWLILSTWLDVTDAMVTCLGFYFLQSCLQIISWVQ